MKSGLSARSESNDFIKARTLYHYHNQNRQMEVDFVTIVDGTICAIEVKSENNGTCPSLNKAVKSKG